VQVVDGKIKVEVDTNELKDALTNVVAVVTSHVEDIKDAAVLSVGNIETLVVGEILVDIITVRIHCSTFSLRWAHNILQERLYRS